MIKNDRFYTMDMFTGHANDLSERREDGRILKQIQFKYRIDYDAEDGGKVFAQRKRSRLPAFQDKILTRHSAAAATGGSEFEPDFVGRWPLFLWALYHSGSSMTGVLSSV